MLPTTPPLAQTKLVTRTTTSRSRKNISCLAAVVAIRVLLIISNCRSPPSWMPSWINGGGNWWSSTNKIAANYEKITTIATILIHYCVFGKTSWQENIRQEKLTGPSSMDNFIVSCIIIDATARNNLIAILTTGHRVVVVDSFGSSKTNLNEDLQAVKKV